VHPLLFTYPQVLCLYSSVLRIAIESTEITQSYTHESTTYPLIDLSDLLPAADLEAGLDFLYSPTRPLMPVKYGPKASTFSTVDTLNIERHIKIGRSLGMRFYLAHVQQSMYNAVLTVNREIPGCYHVKDKQHYFLVTVTALLGDILFLAAKYDMPDVAELALRILRSKDRWVKK
jgi:hypothetical protein